MLRKRIIFTLIHEKGYFNQSRNFRLQKVGDVTWLEEFYKLQEIAFSLDELIVLDATREDRDIESFSKTLGRLVDDVFIPVAAGGGIRSISDAEALFNSGADKIVLNTILHKDKKLVAQLVKRYGSQSIIGSVDYKQEDSMLKVYVENGSEQIELSLDNYLKSLLELNIGEIYLNSIDRDGTGFGYDIDNIQNVASVLRNPLIIAGGAGNGKHLVSGLGLEYVSAVATANLFNFIGDGLPKARQLTIENQCNIACRE
jgi:imidazole glycerol-phosphate synthase subunit HisF